MDELVIYEAVNNAKSLNELANIIRGIADSHGRISISGGRYASAETMAFACERFSGPPYIITPSNFTRRYGIRQQAMMLAYYKSIQG